MTRPPRAVAVGLGTALVAAAVLAVATPAAAHHRMAHAADEVARIVQVAPIDGVSWGVHGGDQLWVENRSGRDLVILGGDGEPYLRIGPEGVFANLRSPATYRNARRADTAAVPADADPAAEPEWSRISEGLAAAWFDHRIHRDDPGAPPTGDRAGDGAEVLAPWVVPFRFGGGQLPVYGQIVRAPSANGAAWLALGAGVALLGATALRRGAPRQVLLPVRAIVAGSAALAVLHPVDALLAVPPGGAPSPWRAVPVGGAVLLAILSVVRSRRPDEAGLALLALGSLGLFLAVGLPGRPALTAGWVDGLAPGWLLRASVALCLAQLVVTVVVVEVARRRVDASPAGIQPPP